MHRWLRLLRSRAADANAQQRGIRVATPAYILLTTLSYHSAMASNRARVPDQASPIHRLAIKPLFDSLPPRDKLYAHYLSQAAWHGARIVLRQTSLESEDIFDFIIKAYHECEGEWSQFEGVCTVTDDEVKAFLSYAGLFLYNLGNFYVSASSCGRRLGYVLTM